jgi:endo-1,4-beta-xylanase
VRKASLQSITLTLGLSLLGCAASDGEIGDIGVGGSVSPGGSTGNGGSPGAGGTVEGQGGTSAQATGGIGVGGSQPTGGTKATGGAPPTGGTKATGGQPATGGSVATGGVNPTGGSLATGGVNPTGGSIANGGRSAGGRATGGATLGGAGKASGGTPATGGAQPTAGGPANLAKFVGNITTGNSVDPSGLKYYKYWDQITPENAGKWGSVQGSVTSAFNWGTLDSIYSYSKTNNIIFKQHVFCWGPQQPSGTPTLAQVEAWIKGFCERFPETKIIDVVNEPPPHTTPNYTANLGAGEKGSYPWITKAFKLARQYCPNAILLLNDYNNLEYASQEQHFIDIVKDIKANGASIDAAGCQGHALKGMSSANLQTAIDKMTNDTGLPVYITEYDIGDSDQNQLTNFQNHFKVFLSDATVKGVTVWGWIEGRTWISNSGIVNGTTPKPAMTWLMGQLGRPVPPN